jgi:hypothetical protein
MLWHEAFEKTSKKYAKQNILKHLENLKEN